jgi:hypothetical protein
MLSSSYALSADQSEKNMSADPENRLLWRANIQRLDAEALRDSLFFVTGELDPKAGGPPVKLNADGNRRRTVYGFVSRNKLDGMLSLFDFPNPNITSEKRNATESPAQELFFLNSRFIGQRAEAFTRRVCDGPKRDEASRIAGAYRLLFGRAPSREELRLGLAFLQGGQVDAWRRYAQALLNSNEFLFVN